MIFLHPDWPSTFTDIGLVRIVASDGSDANLDTWAPIGQLPALSAVTIGGYGHRHVYDAETGLLGPSLGAGELRWGRNIARPNDDNKSIFASLDRPEIEPGMPNPDYIKYEGDVHPGDSGGGWFVRDGWDWHLIGVTCCLGSGATNASYSETLDWIRDTMATDFQGPGHSPKPAATINWIGPLNGSWTSTSNWQDAVSGANRTPDFSSTRADVVNITGNISYPKISASARAQDLFVGRNSASSSAKIKIQSNGELALDSLFVAAEASEFV